MALEMLLQEIGKIESDPVKYFVREALGQVAPEFWTAPSSSTGKYHPPEDQGTSGLIRHIKKGVVVIEEFSRRARFSEYERDLAIASFLLHDSCKNGIPWGEFTDYTHGLIASNWLDQFKLKDEFAKQSILDAVRYHMAPWCYAVSPYRKEGNFTKDEMMLNLDELSRALTAPSRIELAVRDADYWASRPDLSFMPGLTIVYDKRVHDGPDQWLNKLALNSRQITMD